MLSPASGKPYLGSPGRFKLWYSSDELTLAELFKDNGYATACIGKWHLGFREPSLPRNQGFDYYFGLLHNLDPVEVVYFDKEGGVPLLRNETIVKRPAEPAELTERYTDEAIRFMKDNRNHPFFIYIPHTMLHNPIGVSEPFQGSSQWGDYGDAIHELDHNVGRIFQSLENLNLAEKTLVLYASDNGRGPGRNSEQPIRGRKLSTYEGGIRVPAIVWGKGLSIPGNRISRKLSTPWIGTRPWLPLPVLKCRKGGCWTAGTSLPF